MSDVLDQDYSPEMIEQPPVCPGPLTQRQRGQLQYQMDLDANRAAIVREQIEQDIEAWDLGALWNPWTGSGDP